MKTHKIEVYEVKGLALNYIIEIAKTQIGNDNILELVFGVIKKSLDLEEEARFTTKCCFEELVVKTVLQELTTSARTIGDGTTLDEQTIAEVEAAGADQVEIIEHHTGIAEE